MVNKNYYLITSRPLKALFLFFIPIALGNLFQQFLLWLKTPYDVIDLAVTYLRIYFLGFPFVLVYNVTASMYNALGKSKFPLFFLI